MGQLQEAVIIYYTIHCMQQLNLLFKKCLQTRSHFRCKLLPTIGLTSLRLKLENNLGFRKINHFVTFDTSNVYGQNNALYSTSQPYSEYRVSVYTELPENL